MGEQLYPKTAILLFANSAEEEVKHKSLIRAEKLFSELTSHTLDIVGRTGLPYYHFSEKEQTGRSFGERFYNAIEEVYRLGYDNIICIGNDTPQLSADQLVRAADSLANGHMVLGPSTDGGFYLMGLRKSQFDALKFQQLPWQTSGLRDALIAQIHKFDWEAVILTVLRDIDDLSDVLQLVRQTTRLDAHIIAYYHLVTRSAFRADGSLPDFSYTTTVSSFYNKGSPSAGFHKAA